MLYRHCLNLSTWKSSMKFKSLCLHFKPAHFWYSSRTDDKHQFCTFLKHPTRQPVLCCNHPTYTEAPPSDSQSVELNGEEFGFALNYLSALTVDENWMVSYICKQAKKKTAMRHVKEKLIRNERESL